MNLVLLVCTVLFIGCHCQACDKSITVAVTSNATITLPVVNRVFLSASINKTNIMWIKDDTTLSTDPILEVSQSMFENTSYILSATDKGNIENLTISLTFVENQITCRNITLSTSFQSRSTLNFVCVPVSSCNNTLDQSITNIRWMKSYDPDSEYEELFTGNFKSGVEFIRDSLGVVDLTNDDMISIANATNLISNTSLTLTSVSIRSAGHYKAVFDDDTDEEYILQQFTLFYGPEQVYPEHDVGSAITTFGVSNYTEISCAFRSFPNAIVSWMMYENDGTSTGNDLTSTGNGLFLNNVTLTNPSVSPSVTSIVTLPSDNFDFTLTIFGGILISRVEYTDVGMYSCIADNGYNSTKPFVRRLRVRDPLRPLWPVLGIIASIVITIVCILSGYIVERIRGTRYATLSDEDIDGAFRPSSVISFNEDDLKQTGLYRRGSSNKEIDTTVIS